MFGEMLRTSQLLRFTSCYYIECVTVIVRVLEGVEEVVAIE